MRNLFFHTFVWLFIPWIRSEKDTSYLIMSLPSTRQVAYVKLPDNVLRILVPITSGIVTPKGICVDSANSRLFIADAPTMRIVWYQMIALPDGKLITDGRLHTAIKNVQASWCTVDGIGNLFFSGKLIDPLGLPTMDCIYKYDALNIATGATVWPQRVWTPDNSGAPNPCVFAPAGVTADMYSLFWANKEKGTDYGTICRGEATPPSSNPVSIKVANNENGGRGLVLAERYLFYATQNGIYGITREKTTTGCNDPKDCVLVSNDVKDANGVTWDSDGTVFVADTGRASESGTVGAVVSFPSGSLAEHPLTVVLEAQGVYDLAMLTVPSEGAKILTAIGSAYEQRIAVVWILIGVLM